MREVTKMSKVNTTIRPMTKEERTRSVEVEKVQGKKL